MRRNETVLLLIWISICFIVLLGRNRSENELLEEKVYVILEFECSWSSCDVHIFLVIFVVWSRNFGERKQKVFMTWLGTDFTDSDVTDYFLLPMDNKCRLFIASTIRVRCWWTNDILTCGLEDKNKGNKGLKIILKKEKKILINNRKRKLIIN